MTGIKYLAFIKPVTLVIWPTVCSTEKSNLIITLLSFFNMFISFHFVEALETKTDQQ